MIEAIANNLYLITIPLTVLSLIYAMKWYKLAKTYEPMAKQLASMLGTKGAEVRGDKARKQRVNESFDKASKNIVENIPFAKEILGFTGLSEKEAIELILDEEVGQKIVRIILLLKEIKLPSLPKIFGGPDNKPKIEVKKESQGLAS